MSKKEKIFVLCLFILTVICLVYTSVNKNKSVKPKNIKVIQEDITEAELEQIEVNEGGSISDGQNHSPTIVVVDKDDKVTTTEETTEITEQNTTEEGEETIETNIITEENYETVLLDYVKFGDVPNVVSFFSSDFTYTDNVNKNRSGEIATIVNSSFTDGYVIINSYFMEAGELSIRYTFTLNDEGKISSITSNIEE